MINLYPSRRRVALTLGLAATVGSVTLLSAPAAFAGGDGSDLPEPGATVGPVGSPADGHGDHGGAKNCKATLTKEKTAHGDAVDACLSVHTAKDVIAQLRHQIDHAPTIRIHLPDGKQIVVVPGMVGKQITQALAKLRASGLQCTIKITKKPTKHAAPGTVIGQDLTDGTSTPNVQLAAGPVSPGAVIDQSQAGPPAPDQAGPDQAGPEQVGPEQAGTEQQPQPAQGAPEVSEQAGPEQAGPEQVGPEQSTPVPGKPGSVKGKVLHLTIAVKAE